MTVERMGFVMTSCTVSVKMDICTWVTTVMVHVLIIIVVCNAIIYFYNQKSVLNIPVGMVEIVPKRDNMTINAHVFEDIPEITVRPTCATQKVHVGMMERANQILNTIVGTAVLVVMDFLGKTVRLVRIELLLTNKINGIIIL